MVDAVFQPGPTADPSTGIDVAAGTFWVTDVLFWNTTDLASCAAEFRCYWLACKAAEERAAWGGNDRQATLAAVTYHAADAGACDGGCPS